MSDATLPPPCPSSAAVEDGNRTDSRSPEQEHGSNASLAQPTGRSVNEGSNASSEGKTAGKQKRKRTSPKDQAILEAEYKHNPKPNKAARAVIMEKVDLNEKELQIWFQNRRQINRRKSRPLLPHELAAFGIGGIAALSSDPASTVSFSSSQSQEEPAIYSQEGTASSQDVESKSSQVQEDIVARVSQTTSEFVEPAIQRPENALESSNTPLPRPPPMLRANSSPETLDDLISTNSESVIKSFSSTPGYLANRWNPANSSSHLSVSSQNPTSVTPPISNSHQPSSCPGRIDLAGNTTAAPRVRLSMSLDGKAELVSADLSPPRPSSASSLPQQRIRGLQRSHSALPFGPLPRLSSTNNPLAPRLPRGRSRDARNWEFFCDSEARDELTTQAEHESNGSAVAAISLLRSASNTALKSNSNKRNAPSSKGDSSSQGKRPKLGRAMSSLARLQGTEKLSKTQSTGKDGLMRSPSGDSDKENWVPGENGAIPRRRPLPSERPDGNRLQQTALGENHSIPTHAHNFGGSKNKRRRAAQAEPQIFEDKEGEASQEVEQFMRGEVSPSKKGDLDCIQGLLSLSQGNWR